MRGRDTSMSGIGTRVLLAVALTALLTGCGSFSGMLKADDGLIATPTSPGPAEVVPASSPAESPLAASLAADVDVDRAATIEQPFEAVALDAESPTASSLASEEDVAPAEGALPDVFGGSALAQRAQDPTDAVDEEYDPWERFNEKTFAFNRELDRWVFKPAARMYMFMMPEPWQVLVSNGFDNISFVPRLINSMLQGKWSGAGREVARFLINSTAGIGGLFDPAKDFWGIHKSREDFGQTLGVWGAGPGPYLVLPFMEPLTVRDGIGKAVDGLLDPLSYLLPFIWDRLAMKVGDAINERALNYDLFQGFEESVIDMYSAVRHGYLQRRQQLIRE